CCVMPPTDTTTMEKILDAARKLFVQQGFAATTTRDIAKEAGINLALVNYYYGSKQNLFKTIMVEHMKGFMKGLSVGINDPSRGLEEKFAFMADSYISMLLVQPDVPLFLLRSLREEPDVLFRDVGIGPILTDSLLMKEIDAALKAQGTSLISPLQIFINLMGLCVFPFIARPILQMASGIDDEKYTLMMNERRTLIAQWMMAMITTKRQ
ncbi:MAG TPA: helix-turn-helix domain-containing protein, partial [Candidatus Didemnitutus sp.]|nr:helix-turn-helix domain-containing protein [Candidatus Didemnitutus sp.]